MPSPSRVVDALLHKMYVGPTIWLSKAGPISEGQPVPAYTSSIDAATQLVGKTLPGWIWRLCQCSVTDDAWLMPDMNDPKHSEDFARRWPDIRDPLEDGPGLDMSLTPPGQPALALIAVYVEVQMALHQNRQPSDTLETYEILEGVASREDVMHQLSIKPDHIWNMVAFESDQSPSAQVS